MDGLLGTFKGHEIYYLDVKDYDQDPEYFNDKDVFWLLTDGTQRLVHRGKVFGKLNKDNSVSILREPLPVKPSRSMSKVAAAKQTQAPAARGNPTVGVNHVVTERKSVEWYVQHTIDMLNEGVKYGEKRLDELRSRTVVEKRT